MVLAKWQSPPQAELGLGEQSSLALRVWEWQAVSRVNVVESLT